MSTTSERTAKFISTLSDKDYEGLRAMGCDKMSFVTPDYDGTGGKTFSDYLSKWTGGFPDYVLEAGPIISEGDRSAYTWVFRGTNSGPLEPGDGSSLPATNRKVEVGVSGWATWQGDQLTEMSCYWDQLAIFQQLGLA
jgi:predicted ester cyclase